MTEQYGKIVQFSDGSFLEYAHGKFDPWCVFYNGPDGSRFPPRDVEYFQQLLDYSEKLGAGIVYSDYVTLYNATGKSIEAKAFAMARFLSEKYPDPLEAEKLFCILYLAMLAEERKAGTKLGKRIKRLGIYRLLIEKKGVAHSANFMRGMNWRDIDALCRERGF
ncbi:MAG: hypothetical protein IJS52_02930 [Bacilli bacterium]|nr:hypothetical protein [Bacilli bacterium]